jgi:glycosyltransferase involved in cell wall biosynthesis
MLNSKHALVLYVSYDGLTDPLGESQILPYLSGLAMRGHRITVISFEKRGRFEGGKEKIQSLCQDAGIEWSPITYHKSPPVVSTLYDVYLMRNRIRELVSHQKFEIVHCRSYIAALAGLWMKRKYGTKFIFDMRGFWADERVEGGLWKLANPLYSWVYNFFKTKERVFIQEADHVVVLTREAGRVLNEWGFIRNISVIPCCVDLSLFNPMNFDYTVRNALRKELGLSVDTFVLIYIGSLGTWYLQKEMERFFRSLQKAIPDSRFLILTPDLDKVPDDKNVIALSVSRNEVPAYVALADASICFIKPSFSKKGSSATKMAEVLAMERLVITNEGWGDVEFLGKNLAGLVVISTDQAFDLRMLSRKANRTEWFVRTFSLEAGINSYDAIYESL